VFCILVLPALLLDLLCVLALLFSRTIDTKIRVLLGNIFAADVMTLFGDLVIFLSHPVEVNKHMDTSHSCEFGFSAVFTSGAVKLPTTSLYAIVVYIYVKYSIKIVKLHMVIIPIIITWIIASVVGVMPYTSAFNVFSNRGICSSDPFPLIHTLSLTVLSLNIVVSLSIQVVFGVLTFCYVKRNTSQERNQALLKAIVKLLVYFLVGSFLDLIPIATVFVSGPVQRSLKGDAATKFDLAAYYTRQALYVIPYLLAPIMTIVLLKPVRDSVQRICCVKCMDRVSPVNPALGDKPLTNPGNPAAVELRGLETVTHNALEEMNLKPADREQNADGTSRRPPSSTGSI
jgi:hypothetical protein